MDASSSWSVSGAVDTARSLMSAQPLMLSFFIFRRPPMSRMHLYVSSGQRETSSVVRRRARFERVVRPLSVSLGMPRAAMATTPGT